MPKTKKTGASIEEISQQVTQLRRRVAAFDPSPKTSDLESATIRKFVDESGKLLLELRELREAVSPVHFGAIGISLGRSDGIAKFFAFSFVNQPKRPLTELSDAPFYGSGVYAIYYVGRGEKAYKPLSATETPIYFGKSTPGNANAETVEEQGQSLYKRLKEHAKNIALGHHAPGPQLGGSNRRRPDVPRRNRDQDCRAFPGASGHPEQRGTLPTRDVISPLPPCLEMSSAAQISDGAMRADSGHPQIEAGLQSAMMGMFPLASFHALIHYSRLVS